MNGYERLSFKEAQMVWDKERFHQIPEQERELLSEEMGKAEGCLPSCWDCPYFEDCYGISAIPSQITEAAL
jgi:hypothetical protein